MKEVLRRAKKQVQEWLGISADLTVPPDLPKTEMFLYLGSLLVGILTASEGRWRFEYSEEFKGSDVFRPLVDFPDVNVVYEQEELWQFFVSRIPNTLQPDVESVIEEEHIDENDIIALLKRFGGRTITNPYELRSKRLTAFHGV